MPANIVMVSRGGERFEVAEELAKSASPYFVALLENGMLEAGDLNPSCLPP
jgi:hypothetical protein